jgi:hypothetical protein
LADEPGPDTEADRDAPHPSQPDPLDSPPPRRVRTGTDTAGETVRGMDLAARHDLAAKLAAIKHAPDTCTGSSTTSTSTSTSAGDRTGRGQRRRLGPGLGRTKLYLHITDETLLAGGGVARVEEFGPVFAAKLGELLGHDRIIVQPVIDLNDHVSVDAYEIPHRIRERIKLTYPIEQFPYGTRETTESTDLDHVVPYDPAGPPGQTSTSNLRPQGRLSHRIKPTAAGKSVPWMTTPWSGPPNTGSNSASITPAPTSSPTTSRWSGGI